MRRDAEPEQLFRWVTLSLVLGTDGAIRLAKREGRTDWKEIDAFAEREVLSEVPRVEDMLAALENAQKDEDPESSIRLVSAVHACPLVLRAW